MCCFDLPWAIDRPSRWSVVSGTNIKSNHQPNMIANFGHSSTILSCLTSLGIEKDSHILRAGHYVDMDDRKFRTSQLCPLASNLGAVKYECQHDAEKNKVLFLLNEKPLEFDWCKSKLCDWSDVEKKY